MFHDRTGALLRKISFGHARNRGAFIIELCRCEAIAFCGLVGPMISQPRFRLRSEVMTFKRALVVADLCESACCRDGFWPTKV